MKVLLLAPLCEHPRYPLYFPSENLGIAYITSYLRAHGIHTDVYDANMQGIKAEEIPNEIHLENYNLIGIASSSFLLINEAVKIAEVIKSYRPDVHITIGGHFATFAHKEILEYSINVDSVVRGEGEETVLDLALAIDQGLPLNSIKGLTFRSFGGNVITNSSRELLADLNAYPWPARDTLGYLQKLGHSWPTQITTSRGCYANCSFCDIRAFSGTSWRYRSEIDVVNEIEYLNKTFGSTVFRFTDDEFIGPKPHGPQRATRIANEILKRGLDVKLMIDARAHMVEKDLFSILKKAGVFDCLIGIESGVERILKLYNKGITVETNINAIKILKELDISLNLAFIMFDPRMTFDELKENFRFLMDHKIVTTDSLKSWIWPLDGTPLKKTLMSEELVSIDKFDEFKYNFTDPKVAKVFGAVEYCTNITFEFERDLYHAKKFRKVLPSELEYINMLNLNLWIQIFEKLLDDYDCKWDDFVKEEISKIHALLNQKIRQAGIIV